MLSKRHRFFCLRIEKNASKSLRTLLRPYTSHVDSVMGGVKQISDRLAKFGITEDEWLYNYYKFTFVRNPYKRIVSYYFHLYRRNGAIFRNIKGEFPSEETFLQFVKLFRPVRKRKFINQYDFLIDRRGMNPFDFIGKLETIERDIKRIEKKTGIKFKKIPHKNKTDYGDYRIYYNDESYEIVTRKFRKDIKNFRYKFE